MQQGLWVYWIKDRIKWWLQLSGGWLTFRDSSILSSLGFAYEELFQLFNFNSTLTSIVSHCDLTIPQRNNIWTWRVDGGQPSILHVNQIYQSGSPAFEYRQTGFILISSNAQCLQRSANCFLRHHHSLAWGVYNQFWKFPQCSLPTLIMGLSVNMDENKLHCFTSASCSLYFRTVLCIFAYYFFFIMPSVTNT